MIVLRSENFLLIAYACVCWRVRGVGTGGGRVRVSLLLQTESSNITSVSSDELS